VTPCGPHVDQSDLGFIDTSIVGVYLDRQAAREHEAVERRKADGQGLMIEHDESNGEWQVCWFVEEHAVS
jgi:hypothetical protein